MKMMTSLLNLFLFIESGPCRSNNLEVLLLLLSGVVEQHLEQEMVADDRDVISFVFPTWRKIYHLAHDQAALVLAV